MRRTPKAFKNTIFSRQKELDFTRNLSCYLPAREDCMLFFLSFFLRYSLLCSFVFLFNVFAFLLYLHYFLYDSASMLFFFISIAFDYHSMIFLNIIIMIIIFFFFLLFLFLYFFFFYFSLFSNCSFSSPLRFSLLSFYHFLFFFPFPFPSHIPPIP